LPGNEKKYLRLLHRIDLKGGWIFMKKMSYFVFVLLVALSFTATARGQEKQYNTVGVYMGVSGG
jgi:hypothetical protein